MKLKLVKQNKRKIVRFTNYILLLIFIFSLGTKLKQCFADFEVQSKKHMKEKFLADLNKIRDNKSGDDLAAGFYFYFLRRLSTVSTIYDFLKLIFVSFDLDHYFTSHSAYVATSTKSDEV